MPTAHAWLFGRGVLTHVASLLYNMLTVIRLEKEKTCTGSQCRWVVPKPLKKIPYLPTASINFKVNVSSSVSSISTTENSYAEVTEVSELFQAKKLSKQHNFLEKISKAGTNPGILRLCAPYSDEYISLGTITGLFLDDLFKPAHLGFNEEIVRKRCSNFTPPVLDSNQLDKINLGTMGQSKNKLWFQLRAGRVTASRLRDVCATQRSNPSKSLLKSICYPIENKFKSIPTTYGIQHEKDAIYDYFNEKRKSHTDFHCYESGFLMNNGFPFMGASPDGIIMCPCDNNELGVLEVKCPYVLNGGITIKDTIAKNSNFMLQYDDKNNYVLKKNHKYYYQVQAQIHMAGVQFSDFVVWSPNEIHIERIERDTALWNIVAPQAKQFFDYCIMPEMFGKIYTRKTT